MTNGQPGILVCPALRMPTFRGAYVGCKAGVTRSGWHTSVQTDCSRLDTAEIERPSRAYPIAAWTRPLRTVRAMRRVVLVCTPCRPGAVRYRVRRKARKA